jgi:biotin carboxylase
VVPNIAVLHHDRSFFPLDLFQQVRGSAEILWVLSSGVSIDTQMERLLRRTGKVVDLAGLDEDRAAAALDLFDPDGIVSFVDDHLVTAAALAAHLGLRYHTPEVAGVLMDKRLQRDVLARAGIPGPSYWTLCEGATAEQVEALASEITYPAVLKPAQGSGSRGILRVSTPEEFRALDLAHGAPSGYVIEEYLYADAPLAQWYASYFSVETVVSEGRPNNVAITGRFPLADPFRETGNFIPGILAPELQGPVLELVSGAVEALSIRDAVVHTEIKLTADGPKIIEVNGRLGGRPPFVLRDVSDVNLFEAACQLAAGRPFSWEGLAACEGVGYWLMLQPPMTARRLSRVGGVDACATLPGVSTVTPHVQPGDPVDWREGTDSRVITIRGKVSDHRALAETVDLISGLVDVEYEAI